MAVLNDHSVVNHNQLNMDPDPVIRIRVSTQYFQHVS